MTTETAKISPLGRARGHIVFGSIVVLSVIAFSKTLGALITLALQNESYSHIILIPFVTCYLLYTDRKRIFQEYRGSVVLGGGVILVAIAFYLIVASHQNAQEPNGILSGAALSIVLVWMGGFLLVYGVEAWRKASFPLIFLLLMVPLPTQLLDRVIRLLQQGSTEITCLLFKAVGVPVFREGFVLTVPGLSIEVAQECSGIRSSMALFITCLLAAHLFLRTTWKKLVFVLLSFPLAIVKNGIRIATLTLLSIYVDRGFLSGNLHREGGFVFFLLALGLLAPVLFLLQRSEVEKPTRSATIPTRAEKEQP